jgi:hypothetical protein
VYNGLSKRAVVELWRRKQEAERKNRHFACSKSEEKALIAYADERLANMGHSADRAAPDCQATWQTAPIEMGRTVKTPEGQEVVVTQCGSVETVKANVAAYRAAHGDDKW